MNINDNFTIGIYGIKDINNSKIPTLSHDHGITIMKNGRVIYTIELERINRNKHSADMGDMIYDLLKEKKLLDKQLNLVFVDNVLGRSFINNIGNIRFEAPLNNGLKSNIEEGRLWWLNQTKKAYILNHELAHLGSCLPFFGPFKDNSLLIHFDGGASKSNFSAWTYKNGELKNLEFGWKLKWLSSLFNANAVTFALVNAKQHELNSVPGKFMGFASYGSYSSIIEDWLKENKYFENIWGSKNVFFKSIESKFGIKLKLFDQKNSLLQDIAATIHHIFVRESYNEFEKFKNITKTDYLYYSGGSALNIILNTKLIKSNLFKQVFIPPCCNDSGLSLGAAAFYEWINNKNCKIHSPYLNNWNIKDYKIEYSINSIKETAQLLIRNKVIGVCNEYGEIGPRALGNRSILCLASSNKLALEVSTKLKKREWYRPVAPIMLEKNSKYFTGLSSINQLSKYMLLDFNILDDKKRELEGAVHISGTARIQTIFNREDNPFIYDLLEYLDEKFGVKALINTSFNIKGEPIVHTTNDAVKSASNMGLGAVILNGELKILTNLKKQ